MKLLIEINDYEKLKNIVETPMDDKRRKIKNILLCVTGLLFFASLALMINAICQKANLIIIFSILTLIFLYCFVNILTDNGAHLVNIYNKIQEMQKSSDEQSCLQIESWIKYSNTLEFQYFDKDGIMQRMIIPYEKDTYTNMTTTRLQENLMRMGIIISSTCTNRTEKVIKEAI